MHWSCLVRPYRTGIKISFQSAYTAMYQAGALSSNRVEYRTTSSGLAVYNAG